MDIEFQRFELENWQSNFEQEVAYNLADSTVHPVSLGEVFTDPADVDLLLGAWLYYPEVNGESALRAAIAAQYPPGAVDVDRILVTVGASEANATIVDAFCRPGRRVIVMEPGYRQVWGLARNRGCDVRGFGLDPQHGWQPDLDELERLANGDTDLIYVCNPNNPLGYVLSDAEMQRIVEIADSCGAWLVADEVYAGTEHSGDRARTFVGRSDRVLGVNSMSKSFGLSGIRIGWVTGPLPAIDDLWRRHEYAVISAGRVDNMVATKALEQTVSKRLLDRNRAAMNEGWVLFERWMAELDGLVTAHRPAATPLAFFSIASSLSSIEVCERLRDQASVLTCPGVFFGREGYTRLNFGFGSDYVASALKAMTDPITRMCEEYPA